MENLLKKQEKKSTNYRKKSPQNYSCSNCLFFKTLGAINVQKYKSTSITVIAVLIPKLAGLSLFSDDQSIPLSGSAFQSKKIITSHAYRDKSKT